MIYAAIATGLLTFTGSVPGFHANAPAVVTANVQMAEPMLARRSVIGTLGAAVAAAPLAAFADGATSKATVERSRQIYGSRVARLVSADTDTIIAEKNAFTLFTSGGYRSVKDKETKAALTKASKTAISAANKGDKAGAQAAVKEFIAIGGIKEQDTLAGGNYNPTQRRNPGAPPTSEIEAQMGTQAFALYRPLK